MNLNDDITAIKGIGDKNSALYRKLNLNTVDDVIHNYPRNYVYYSNYVTLSQENDCELTAIRATLIKQPLLKVIKQYKITTASLKSGNETISVTWFNMPYLKKSLIAGNEYIFRGVPEKKNGYYVMEQPQIFTIEQYEKIMNTYQPVYSLVKGLTNNSIIKTTHTCFDSITEYDKPLYDIHFPDSMDTLVKAREYLVYEEFLLFILRLRMLRDNNERAKNDFNIIPVAQTRRIIDKLPYRLTNAQASVFACVEEELTKNHSMSRLIQGDVGCGKTIIAILAAITVAINGYQCAIMAPTEILASQHFEYICKLIRENNLDITPVLLIGSLSASTKKEVYKKISSGQAHIIIGTHALIQDKVEYNSLALVITDEQHRFGVNQRIKLASKNNNSTPHILVMSATPIPRTLAIIMYGDLDVSVIDEVPAQRLPIKNCVVNTSYRNTAYNFMLSEISKGHQIYVICPLVEASEALTMTDVISYTDKIKSHFGDSTRIAYLHGKMRPSDKQKTMDLFANGDIDILVSTTVVEVGVNVPNATVMLIEDADRFGLAQLHQLRGRIGRGDAQSYCIFMSSTKSEKTIERLSILNKSNDGFYIASEDLKLRGPGDIFGVRQSGDMRFRLADIYTDASLLQKASEDADKILKDDPLLEKSEHIILKNKLALMNEAIDGNTSL